MTKKKECEHNERSSKKEVPKRDEHGHFVKEKSKAEKPKRETRKAEKKEKPARERKEKWGQRSEKRSASDEYLSQFLKSRGSADEINKINVREGDESLGLKRKQTYHDAIALKKMLGHEENFNLVTKKEAQEFPAGKVMNYAVNETVRSGHEVGFAFDTATNRPVSPVREGTKNQVMINVSDKTQRNLKQQHRLGDFHTHPTNMIDIGPGNKDLLYATTFSAQDYLTNGGSDKMVLAVPRGLRIGKYTLFKSKGVDNNKKLKRRARKVFKKDVIREMKNNMGMITPEEEKKAVGDLHRFQHEMGVQIEQIPYDKDPADFDRFKKAKPVPGVKEPETPGKKEKTKEREKTMKILVEK